MIEALERELDSFAAEKRFAALRRLVELRDTGQVEMASPSGRVNMHGHTFFSYNSLGYSPVGFAWRAAKAGLVAAGIVDFDVLDGVDEFVQAGRLLDLPTCGGIETRVFVPEFADKVMTSPGEPGITYHMGVGIPTGRLTGETATFQQRLKDTAQERNRGLIERVNAYLAPVCVDYERDVLPLTPAANPTERHICVAYARKAAEHFGVGATVGADREADEWRALVGFWSEKLGVDVGGMELPEGRELLNTIRAKTMKRGGAGYVQPDAGAFPKMAEVNAFVRAVGGIPTLTWLNGLSDGERELDRLLDIAMATGVEAINIIPDRNFTPGVEDELVANLRAVIGLAAERGLPIVVGTEMNSPGQKFVDDFDAAELAPHVPLFLQGAWIVYAHSVLQRRYGLGYTSEWARRWFGRRAARNAFYEAFGQALKPSREEALPDVGDDPDPDELLAACG